MEQDYGPDAWLNAFSSAYGRMCLLAAQALRQGISKERVRMALAGEASSDMQAQLFGIRRQRRYVVTLLKQAQACGVAQAAIIEVGREARQTIGAEWGVEIPNPAETT